MTTSQLHCPVALLGKDGVGTFDVVLDERSLLATTPLALRRGKHLLLKVVDSAGCGYDIVSVSEPPKSALRQALGSSINGPAIIEMRLSDNFAPVSTDELSQRGRTAFENPAFAEVYAGQGLQVAALDIFLSAAKSVSEIPGYLAKESWEDGGDT